MIYGSEYFSSNSMLMMERAMDFLWTKQAAISDNIANAETPGYKTKVVTFEENLRGRLESAVRAKLPRAHVRDILSSASFEVTDAPEVTRMDDNGVNTTEQMVELARNAYQIRYVYNAISSDLSTLRSAIRG